MRIYEFHHLGKRFCPCAVDRTVHGALEALSHQAFLEGGSSITSLWAAPTVQWLQNPARKPLLLPDLLHFNMFGVLLLSDQARTVLGPLLTGTGEWLPVLCQQGIYHAFQVTQLVVALDPKWARFKGGPGSHALGAPRIREVYMYAFLPDRLQGIHMFMVLYHNAVLVSDEFVRLAKSKRLRTFDFRLVWDSEDPGFVDERWWAEQWQLIRSMYGVTKEDLIDGIL